jgi:hypothetical protein
MIKYPSKTLRGGEDLFGLVVSEVSVHHGREFVVDQLTSWQQGAKREDACAGGFLLFPLIPPRSPTYEVVPPTFREG